jgi:hypothetical protein
MERNVPSSLWFGTGTVIVELSVRRCIIMWLPLCLTLEKPFFSRIRQTSSPESTGNLGNAHLQRGHVGFSRKAFLNFLGGGTLEKQFHSLSKIQLSFLNRIALARNINFGAQGCEPLFLADQNGSKCSCHSINVRCLPPQSNPLLPPPSCARETGDAESQPKPDPCSGFYRLQDHRIIQAADFFDFDGDPVACLEPARRFLAHADAVRCSGENHGSGQERSAAAEKFD